MINQSIQFGAWLITLVELVLGLYVLVLNARHSANRHACALLLIIAANTFAVGWMISANTPGQGLQPAILLAITTPAIPVLLSVTTIALLKSEWLRRRGRWLGWLVYLLALIPAIATFLDLGLGTHYWFGGLPSSYYSGGYVQLDRISTGQYASIIQTIAYTAAPALAVLLLLYFIIFDKQILSGSRRLAWLLITAIVTTFLLSKFVAPLLLPAFAALLSSTIVAAAYSYAAFQQMISERRAQRGSLQARLVALILIVTMPLLIAVSVFVTRRAGSLLEQDALSNLRTTNRGLSSVLNIWLDSNVRALKVLSSQPDITSMDPSRQKPILETMVAAYSHMVLVSTIDLNGLNNARSDSEALKDYSDQIWFQKARQGAPLTLQALVDRASKKPILVAATPIKNESDEIVGVAMFATNLDKIAAQLQTYQVGANDMAFIVDDQNQALTHPDPAFTSELRGMSLHPAVLAARDAKNTSPDGILLSFSDGAGTTWRACANQLENGWVVIVQRPESELLAGVFDFQRVALIALGVGALLLLFLSWITIRQAIQPISDLTEAAASIAAGDLTRVATIQSDDEIGSLARAYNSMTTQLRESITNLERRIAERTRDLERRAVQLQVAAEVANQSAAIRELSQLLDHTVRLISERFNFYHAGIFLIDENEKYAVLRAASSEGGQRMLARNHKLAVGQTGIVGYVTGKGESRIALDVGSDAVYFNNPDLPQTRSEMALPLKVRGRVIGALDVQSTKAAAFSTEDVEVLQVLADQVALAIDNARIHAESERIIRELNTLYKQQISQSWQRRLESDNLAFTYRSGKVINEASPGVAVPSKENDGRALNLPLALRGQSLGEIVLRRHPESPPWSKEEIALAHQIASQIALSLENARLLEENRRRARNEFLVGQITGKTQGLLDIETVIKTATEEIGRSLGLARIQIRLGNGNSDDVYSNEADEVPSPEVSS
jgi:GAF domain-containing protein/HAMP domain-containing protein